MLKKDDSADQNDRAPRAGEIMHNPSLARPYRALAAEGKKSFYSGRIADAIVEVLRTSGGYMKLSDLEDHMNRTQDQPTALSKKHRGQGIGKKAAQRISDADQKTDNYYVELWERDVALKGTTINGRPLGLKRLKREALPEQHLMHCQSRITDSSKTLTEISPTIVIKTNVLFIHAPW